MKKFILIKLLLCLLIATSVASGTKAKETEKKEAISSDQKKDGDLKEPVEADQKEGDEEVPEELPQASKLVQRLARPYSFRGRRQEVAVPSVPDDIFTSSMDAMDQNSYLALSQRESDGMVKMRAVLDSGAGRKKRRRGERMGQRRSGVRRNAKINQESRLKSRMGPGQTKRLKHSYKPSLKNTELSQAESIHLAHLRRMDVGGNPMKRMDRFDNLEVKPIESMKTFHMTPDEFESLDTYPSTLPKVNFDRVGGRWSARSRKFVDDNAQEPRYFESKISDHKGKHSFKQGGFMNSFKYFENADAPNFPDQRTFATAAIDKLADEDRFKTRYSYEFNPSGWQDSQRYNMFTDGELNNGKSRDKSTNFFKDLRDLSYRQKDTYSARYSKEKYDKKHSYSPAYNFRDKFKSKSKNKNRFDSAKSSFFDDDFSRDITKVAIKPGDVVNTFVFRPPKPEDIYTSDQRREEEINPFNRNEMDDFVPNVKEFESSRDYPRNRNSFKMTRIPSIGESATTTERSTRPARTTTRIPYRRRRTTTTTTSRPTTTTPSTTTASTTTPTPSTTAKSPTERFGVHHIAGPPYNDDISLDRPSKEDPDIVTMEKTYEAPVYTIKTTTERIFPHSLDFGEKQIFESIKSEEPFIDFNIRGKHNHRDHFEHEPRKHDERHRLPAIETYESGHDGEYFEYEDSNSFDAPNSRVEDRFSSIGKFDDVLGFNSAEFGYPQDAGKFFAEDMKEFRGETREFEYDLNHRRKSNKRRNFESNSRQRDFNEPRKRVRSRDRNQAPQEIFRPSTRYDTDEQEPVVYPPYVLKDSDHTPIKHVKYENLEEFVEEESPRSSRPFNRRNKFGGEPGRFPKRRNHDVPFGVNSFETVPLGEDGRIPIRFSDIGPPLLESPRIRPFPNSPNFRAIDPLPQQHLPYHPHGSQEIFSQHGGAGVLAPPVGLPPFSAEVASRVAEFAMPGRTRLRHRHSSREYPDFSISDVRERRRKRRRGRGEEEEDSDWSIRNVFNLPESIGDMFG